MSSDTPDTESLAPGPELSPRPYQQDAIEAWVDSGGQGILNMATGTGKTITSLFAATKLARLQDGRLALVITVPYQHLVDQWSAELAQFGVTPIKAYGSRTSWIDDAVSAITEFTVGARDLVALVTTQKTFSMEHFQGILDRLPGGQTLLIGDEVHHMGADHIRTTLPTAIRARLGLSATPNRWFDDEGTTELFSYFGDGIVYEYGLQEAIANGYLCEYYYVPHIVELTDDEKEEYLAISRAIGRLLSDSEADLSEMSLQDDETLQQLLIKRSRLVGTAVNKLEILEELLDQQSGLEHTLVYCGDGRVPAEAGAEDDDDNDDAEGNTKTVTEMQRHIRAVTRRLGTQLGLRVHQFTYEESQPERTRLLDDFESGSLQALVAIRCLDEGVDVPATRTAFMLASSSNPRQFVQRRGRILRTHPGKNEAIIHDFIVRPPADIRAGAKESDLFNVEQTLIRKQLKRASTFADAAINHPDVVPDSIPSSNSSLTQLKRRFNLLDY